MSYSSGIEVYMFILSNVFYSFVASLFRIIMLAEVVCAGSFMTVYIGE